MTPEQLTNIILTALPIAAIATGLYLGYFFLKAIRKMYHDITKNAHFDTTEKWVLRILTPLTFIVETVGLVGGVVIAYSINSLPEKIAVMLGFCIILVIAGFLTTQLIMLALKAMNKVPSANLIKIIRESEAKQKALKVSHS